MKLYFFLFFLLCSVFVFTQETISDQKKAFTKCRTSICKITISIAVSEHYLELDEIEEAQKWLNYSKKMLLKYPDSLQEYATNSLQSEIFYYSGLYQFGVHEAQKAITIAKKNKDSLYLSNAYLLEGINWCEIGKLAKAEACFHNAEKIFSYQTESKFQKISKSANNIFIMILLK